MRPSSRTPEREALLRAEYPEATDVMALMARVNALPGLPFNTKSAFRTYAMSLGLRKSPAALNAIFAPSRRAGGLAVTERLRGIAISISLRVWTPERLAMLRAEYATVLNNALLAERIAALPGPPIGGRQAVVAKAVRLGLKKSAAAISEAARERMARRAAAAPRRPTARTPERRALMLARYATEADPQAFLAVLNALPGRPLTGLRAVHSWACRLRLRKAPDVLNAIRLSEANGARSRNALARREERVRERERRKQERMEAAGRAYVKPRAPEMRKPRIPPPLAPELPAPPPPRLDGSPEAADQAMQRRHDMARRMIAKKREAAVIAQTCALPLREVFRLAGEMRRERAAA